MKACQDESLSRARKESQIAQQASAGDPLSMNPLPVIRKFFLFIFLTNFSDLYIDKTRDWRHEKDLLGHHHSHRHYYGHFGPIAHSARCLRSVLK
jgi:hypothetical protein